MYSYTILFLCIQVCLIQGGLTTLIGPAVYGNDFGLGNSVGASLTAASAELAGWNGCNSPASYNYASKALERDLAYGSRARSFGYGAAELCVGAYAPTFAPPPFAYESNIRPYGGEGIGDITVAGEMPVAGTTIVAGQVPILGAVRFGGDLLAGGVVTIAGNSGCGCRY